MSAAMLASSRVPRDPQRPTFGPDTAISWAIYPVLHTLLSRTRTSAGTYPEWVMEMPNRITKSRFLMLVMAPLFALATINHWVAGASVCLLCIVGLLFGDAIDGAWARYVDNTTDWGARWDPYLDKVATAALMASWLVLIHHFVPGMFRVLLTLALVRVFEDFYLAIIAWFEGWLKRQPKAGLFGKVKATFDYAAITVGFVGMIEYSAGVSGASSLEIGRWLLILACVFGPLSILEHLRNLLTRRRTTDATP